MNILSNIIRGGQLSLHALRMFKQVFNALVLWSCAIAVTFFCFKVYSTITKQEIISLTDYYTAIAMTKLGFKQKLKIVVDGHKYSISPSECLRSPYFQKVQKDVEFKLIKSLVISYNLGLISFVLLSIIFVIKGLRSSGEKFNRGAQLHTFDEIKKAIETNNKGADSYSIAKMPYPNGAEMEHTLVIGTTGVGKTVLISDLVEQIRNKGDKAVIYDKKCDYIKWFYNSKQDFILNPFDARGKQWNLVQEIESIAHIKSIAESFISDKNGYGEKIWEEAARLAFSGILEKLICTKSNVTNEMIVDLLLRQDMESLAEFVKNTHAHGTIDPSSPKTAASVIFTLATYFNSLRLTRSAGENFSIRKWIREAKDSILFISSQDSLAAELAPLQTAWFEIVITGILSQSEPVKTWVILDELPTLQKIPSLSRALSVSRSYGGCFVISVQNIAQMREVYGRNLTESISSECNTRALFKTNDPISAEWIANNIGQTEISEYKEGVSYGAHAVRDGVNVQFQDKLKALVLPSEVQTLPKFSLFLKTANFGTVRTKVSYVNRQIINEPFIYDNAAVNEMRKIYEQPQVKNNVF